MNDLELALQAATTGADVVRAGFGSHRVTEQKGRLDPVTEIDHASEMAIVDMINRHRPEDGLLGEEGSSRDSTGRRWIIDPLDGTVNFIHGIPHVGISVALYDGLRPLVGVVVDALGGEVFSATAGGGAYLNGDSITVSGFDDLHRAVVVTGFPYDHDEYASSYAATLGEVLAHVNGIRRLGSAALDFCWVAAGRFDGYWEYSLGPWDCAAGVLIAAEAGAVVTDALGHPYSIESRHFVAANPRLHSRLQRIVASALPPHLLDR
ncbi:MAG: inositol monophosphatase family protein [Acidimicrobiia bacterium]|nr:inositol monophosphatase family protein [Acidimicrobiia bacterium]